MTDTPKILAQLQPANSTLRALYIVPASTHACISSAIICNTDSSVAYFRIMLAVGGAANSTSQAIYYDLPLDGNDTFIATIGITLAATDTVRIYSSSDFTTFTLLGIEIT